MKVLFMLLLWQSLLLPPRTAMENPARVSPIPQKLKRDYDKLWSRFLTGKEDAKLAKDLDNFLKKQKDIDAAVAVGAYLHLFQHDSPAAIQKFERVLTIKPTNTIALYYLAELAFAGNDYGRASGLYSRLLAADPTRVDVEAKREKALLLGTENILRSAAQAEQQNRLPDAEQFYRQAVNAAPREPAFHERLAHLLAQQKKWDEALNQYRLQMDLAGPNSEIQKNIAEALMNLGRTEEARDILDHLRKQGTVDENLEAKVSELEDLGRWGKDIEVFNQIKVSEVLTREQLAATFLRYFPQIAEFQQTPQVMTDIQNSWARAEIQTVVGIGLIDIMPNHTFLPTSPMSRSQFAVSLARLTSVLPISATAAPPIPVSDVAPSNAIYQEIQLVLGYDLLGLDDSGNFNVNGTVSGREAIRAVERVLQLLHSKQG